jgi:hypothetical protein
MAQSERVMSAYSMGGREYAQCEAPGKPGVASRPRQRTRPPIARSVRILVDREPCACLPRALRAFGKNRT